MTAPFDGPIPDRCIDLLAEKDERISDQRALIDTLTAELAAMRVSA